MAYKIMKYFNKEQKDASDICVISACEWLNHYTELQTSLGEVEFNEIEESQDTNKIEWES